MCSRSSGKASNKAGRWMPGGAHHELVEEVLLHKISGEDRFIRKVSWVVHLGQKPKGQDRRHRLGHAVQRHSDDF
jgi:hypothetical protein